MKFISILPDLNSQIGHIYSYHLSLKKAVERSQINHMAWAPKNCTLNLPKDWKPILNVSKSDGIWRRVYSFFASIRIYISALKTTPDLKESILFLEHFRITDLLSLFFALFWVKQSPQIWLLHRYSPSQMKFQGKLHRGLYRLVSLKTERVKFFTDSDLLAKQQEALFKQPVTTLPIPHGRSKIKTKFQKEPHLIYCWWPGGATRISKGLEHIIRLSEMLRTSHSPLRLVVAKNSLNKGVVSSSSLIAIDDELDRDTYDRWMNTIDIALLPYDPSVYHSGTSGIFVEAICHSKIPLIQAGTWMEYEAKKFGIHELIVDWKHPSLLSQIEEISKNQTLLSKIDSMRDAYNVFHSEEGFKDALEKSLLKA